MGASKLEEQFIEALKEPAIPQTLEQFHRDMEAIAEGYLDDFHKQQSERHEEGEMKKGTL